MTKKRMVFSVVLLLIWTAFHAIAQALIPNKATDILARDAVIATVNGGDEERLTQIVIQENVNKTEKVIRAIYFAGFGAIGLFMVYPEFKNKES